jgi:hypothetical protein
MEVLVRLELVVNIGNDGGGITGALEHLGNGHVFRKELMPTANLDLIVRLLDQLGGEDAPPGVYGATAGNGGLDFP